MDANYPFSDFHYLTAGCKIKPGVLRGGFHLLCFALPSPVSSLTRLKFLTARSIMIRFAQVTKARLGTVDFRAVTEGWWSIRPRALSCRWARAGSRYGSLRRLYRTFVRPSDGCCGQTATMICVRICHWTLARCIGVTVAVISQAALDRRAWGGSQIVVDYIVCIALSTCLRGKRWQILFRASDEERPTRCSVRSIPSAYWDWWHRHRCCPGQRLPPSIVEDGKQ